MNYHYEIVKNPETEENVAIKEFSFLNNKVMIWTLDFLRHNKLQELSSIESKEYWSRAQNWLEQNHPEYFL